MKKITKRSDVTKGLRVRFVEGYKPFSIGNKYLSEADVIRVRETEVHQDAYGYYLNLESADDTLSGYGYVKDLYIDERSEDKLPFYEVYLDKGEEGTEPLERFIFVRDAHYFVNKVKKEYSQDPTFDKWKVKFDRWEYKDGSEIPTKIIEK